MYKLAIMLYIDLASFRAEAVARRSCCSTAHVLEVSEKQDTSFKWTKLSLSLQSTISRY